MRDFVDNQDGNTLAKAINESIKQLRKEGKTPRELLISSAFFNPEGFQSLVKEIKHIPKVRLLLGAEPEPESVRRRRLPGDSPDPFWTEQRVEKSIINLDQALKEERNLLSFDLEKDKAIRTLLKFLQSEKIEVRRYTSRFLHAKAFLFLGDEKQLLTGSSNLTRAGMNSNLELNLGISETPLLEKIEEWYEQLWSDAESYDLAQIYEDLFLDYTPYEIYLMALWQLYGEELDKESEESGTYQLSNFQQHGAERAKKILEKYHGVLIADGVGLGKTYTAGAIINQYHEEKKSVLIICPAALRDSTWSDFRTEKHIWCEILSYEQLRQDIKFGHGKSTHLQEKSLEKYALVVIDEAHHYRNENTLNSQILRALLRQRKKVILLTATPVNNSIQDLYILYSYFLKQDAALSDEGIISLRDLFKKASNMDPLNLNPDVLFPAIDALTVKRPRSFIKKYYPNDHIPGSDGSKIPIIFPRPIPKRVTYNLEELSEDFFVELEEAIMPEDEKPKLTLARYQADKYLLERERTLRIQYIRDGYRLNTKMVIPLEENSNFLFEKSEDNPLSLEMETVDLAMERKGAKVKAIQGINKEEDTLKKGDIIVSINGLKTLGLDEFKKTIAALLSPKQERAHIGLLRSGLLKRFESSVYAFKKTLERLLQSHEVFAEALEEGKVLQREFYQEFNYTNDEEVVKLLLEDNNKFEDSSKYDVDLIKADIENDIEILKNFLQAVQKVDSCTSSKLDELKNQLKKIIKKADKDGVDEVDSQQKRKVMIFSYFEETVDWIEKYLKEVIATDPELKPYKDRLAVVTGGKEFRDGVDKDAAVYGFAPETTKAPEGQEEDKYDVLVCTDVLAEGLNLQQCRNIINYDLPWNPMRLVQRHGRIDRLLSNYDEVYLHSFFPEKRLDQLLGLEERIRRKLAQAAVSIGVEDAPIEGGSESDFSFSDTIDEIKEIYEENSSIYEDGGNFSAAMSGEIYRAELRTAISKKEIDVQSLPRRVGAGLRKGKEPGVFFCAEVSFMDDETEEIKTLTRMRFIPDHWEDENDTVKEIATCLRIIECSEDSINIASSKIMDGVYETWKVAKQSILNDWLFHTDPANLQPKIEKTNREVANYLQENLPEGLEQNKLNNILSSIQAPWSSRDVRSLREVWTMENLDDKEKPQKLIERIEEIGAEPYSAPKPLVPIEADDIRLVCWMAIQAEDKKI